jgi:biotin synthase
MFYGERLLTTDNPETDRDRKLFSRLGIEMEKVEDEQEAARVCCNA